MTLVLPDHDRYRDITFASWLEAALERVLFEQGVLVSVARFFRVSSLQPSVFIANLTAGLMSADHTDPDVAKAKEVGGLLVERTVEGAAARFEHRTIELRVGMLPGGGESQRLIGYATVFGTSLFVYLLASAAKGDLADAGNPEDRGNASTEVVRAVMRAGSQLGHRHDPKYRLRCHFTDETRAARSRIQAAKLTATAKHHKVLLVLRGSEWDVQKIGDQQVIDMLLGMAATERDFVVQRTTRGKVSMLIVHRLPEALAPNVPFTHGPATADRTEEGGRKITVVDEHRPVPLAGAGTVLTDLIRSVLADAEDADEAGEGLDWRALATKVSQDFVLVSSAPEHQGKNVALHTLRDPVTAVRRLLSERYRTAWRTGRLPWVTELPVEIDGLTDQLATAGTAPNGNRMVNAWIDCPIPDDLKISGSEWDELDALLSKSGQPGNPSSGWSRPLRGLDQVVGRSQRSIRMHTGGTYGLLERPVAAATDPVSGRRLGWARSLEECKQDSTTVLLSVNACRLHAEIGADLANLAGELEGQVAALDVQSATPRRSGDPRRAMLTRALKDAQQTLDENRRLADGAKRERYLAEDDDARDEAQRDERLYRAVIAEAEAERDRIAAELAGVQDETADTAQSATAALSSLEEVAAAMQVEWRPDGTVPPDVKAAIRRVLRRSLVLTDGPTVEKAAWEVTVHLPLKDGRTGTFTRHGTVKQSSHAATAHGTAALSGDRLG